jgi:hypothetical protein
MPMTAEESFGVIHLLRLPRGDRKAGKLSLSTNSNIPLPRNVNASSSERDTSLKELPVGGT